MQREVARNRQCLSPTLCGLLACVINDIYTLSGRLRIALVCSNRNSASSRAPACREGFISVLSKIPHRSEPRVCRVRAHAKLIEIRLAGHNGTGILQRLHHRRVERTGVLVQDPGGACRRQFARADVVFDCDQTTVQSRLGISCAIAYRVSIVPVMEKKEERGMRIDSYRSLCGHRPPALARATASRPAAGL